MVIYTQRKKFHEVYASNCRKVGCRVQKNQQEDLRVTKTRRSIKQTFINMLCEMEYEKITVQELTARAMINRKTFYLHYSTLDELLNELQDETMQKFLKRIENMECPKDIDKITREFFTYSEELGKLGEVLNCNDSHVRKRITDELMKGTWRLPYEYSAPCVQSIIKSFVFQATLTIYRQWAADGKKIPLEEVIKIATKLICNGVNVLSEKDN